MAYAVPGDIQDLIPTQLLTIGLASQPTTAQVTSWINEASAWIDAAISWKYVVPITDANDLLLLKTITALYVAAKCWNVIGGHGGQEPANGPAMLKEMVQLLAYDQKTGLAHVILRNSLLRTVDTEMIGTPTSTFTDPTAALSGGYSGVNPSVANPEMTVNDRFFKIGMEF